MNAELTRFEHGAKWVRADFHLHTLKEPGASRKAYRAEFRDRENDFPKDFIAKLHEQEVKVAVITNHNYFDFDEFKCLRNRAKKEGILLLPGVEIGIKEGGGGIHTLIVFDPADWLPCKENTDYINRFLSSQFTSQPDEETRSKDDLCGVLKALDSFTGRNYFLIFAHCQTDNGFFNELDGGAIAPLIKGCGKLWLDRVLGFQKVKNQDGINQIWPKDIPFPAKVEGSDPKNFNQVANQERPCYLKIGELSYAAAEFALRDHLQRVSLTPPEDSLTPRLNKVAFEGGLLDGRTFHLNDQLNCLIGSRGSGKSSFIECLRYGLDLSAQEDASYKDKLVAVMMGNGGKITIEGINEHNQSFTITRIHGNDPIVYLEGGETKLEPINVLPGVLYFGQKDLGDRSDHFEEEFFAKLFTPVSLADRDKEDEISGRLKQAVEDWRNVKGAEEKERTYSQEFEQLKHKLDLFKRNGVEKKLERLTTFDTDKQNLEEFMENLEDLRGNLNFDEDSFNWSDFMDDWITVESPELKDLNHALQTSKTDFKKMADAFDALVKQFDAFLEEYEAHRATLAAKEKELQESFAKIQREIDEPSLDTKEFRALKQRFEQLGKLLKAAKDRGGATQAAQDKILSAARELQEHRRVVFNKLVKEQKVKQAQLPDSLKLEIEFEGNRTSFKDFLRSKLAGSGFRAVSYDSITENFSNGFQLFEQSSTIEDVLNGSADAARLKESLDANIFEFLTFKVSDSKVIRYNGTSVKELSLGQRATALLQLLMSLEEQNILLIDQPEDDLDNETVFQQVVSPLLERKKHTQFIIATHNPNIPVLGDAELVHACHEKEKEVYDHESGSLDSQVTRKSIVAIMEGGEEAFKQRKKIYQQWTNSN